MSQVAELQQEVHLWKTRVGDLESEVRQLREELRLALHRQFGKSSEKVVGQNDLPFEDLEASETPESVEATAVAQHERRNKAGRKPLADSLPRTDVYHELTDAERVCACGHTMAKIGEDVCEKLEMIPAQVWVARHHKAKYACKHCQGLSDESKPAVKTATGESDLFPRSIVSASLLAHIWTAKFCDHLPYYRQQYGFVRIGAEISRQDMTNWTMKVAGQLGPLIDLIERAIREGPVMGMDETPVKILEHPKTGKAGGGYMWVARGGPKDKPAVRYRFAGGRGSQNIRSFLGDWDGFLQTDGYSAYETALEGTPVRHVGCWAHARRKFFDADKVASSALTKDALGRIKKLYEFERQSRDEAKQKGLTDEEFVALRSSLVEPFLELFLKWLNTTAAATLPSGATGKALAYTVGQWDKLIRFTKHANLTPDNNRVGNAIRPFVVGRKNWLFHGNEAGAEASCRVYTLIETAKMNDWEPHAYLMAVLSSLPKARETEDWESLLPWSLKPRKN